MPFILLGGGGHFERSDDGDGKWKRIAGKNFREAQPGRPKMWLHDGVFHTATANTAGGFDLERADTIETTSTVTQAALVLPAPSTHTAPTASAWTSTHVVLHPASGKWHVYRGGRWTAVRDPGLQTTLEDAKKRGGGVLDRGTSAHHRSLVVKRADPVHPNAPVVLVGSRAGARRVFMQAHHAIPADATTPGAVPVDMLHHPGLFSDTGDVPLHVPKVAATGIRLGGLITGVKRMLGYVEPATPASHRETFMRNLYRDDNVVVLAKRLLASRDDVLRASARIKKTQVVESGECKRIGAGSYGAVYACDAKNLGFNYSAPVAVKVFHFNKDEYDYDLVSKSMYEELLILLAVQPYKVHFVQDPELDGANEDADTYPLMVIVDLLPGKTMYDVDVKKMIKPGRRERTWLVTTIHHIIRTLLVDLLQAHDRGFAHGDIKTGNIIVNIPPADDATKATGKLIDWGLTLVWTAQTYKYSASFQPLDIYPYYAPWLTTVRHARRADAKTTTLRDRMENDFYSLGFAFLEMLLGAEWTGIWVGIDHRRSAVGGKCFDFLIVKNNSEYAAECEKAHNTAIAGVVDQPFIAHKGHVFADEVAAIRALIVEMMSMKMKTMPDGTVVSAGYNPKRRAIIKFLGEYTPVPQGSMHPELQDLLRGVTSSPAPGPPDIQTNLESDEKLESDGESEPMPPLAKKIRIAETQARASAVTAPAAADVARAVDAAVGVPERAVEALGEHLLATRIDRRKWGADRSQHGATYAAFSLGARDVVTVGDATDKGPVWSVTKSFGGLVIANAAMRRGGIDVMQPVRDMLFVETNPVVGHMGNVSLNSILTQTSGVSADEFGFGDIYIRLKNGTDIEKLVAEHLTGQRVEPLNAPAPFVYNNAMTQVAEFAYMGWKRQKTGTWRHSLKTEAMSLIFRPAGIGMLEWTESETTKGPQHQSTAIFMGISMTGAQMLQVGKYLVNNANTRAILNFIYDWPHKAEVPPEYSNRQGWHYAFFWWIPPPERTRGWRWLVAIGLMGQYMVLDLTNRAVAVRQHNIDADDIRIAITQHTVVDEDPGFVDEVIDLFAAEGAEEVRPKTRWPDLVGVSAKDAAPIIQSQNPRVASTPVVKPGQAVTTDLRMDRVRLHVDDAGIVIQPPRVG